MKILFTFLLLAYTAANSHLIKAVYDAFQLSSLINNLESENVCGLFSFENTTKLKSAENSFSLTANKCWFPRRVSSSQVSWKPVDEGEGNETSVEKSAKPTLVEYSNSTQIEMKDKKFKKKSRKDKLKKKMVFAVINSDQPFSLHLLNSMRVVGPLYPEVQFVFGDASELQHVIYKYFIRSVPTILLFKKGYLSKALTGSISPLDLAISLSLWLNVTPAAIPYDSSLVHMLPGNGKKSGGCRLRSPPTWRYHYSQFTNYLYHPEYDSNWLLIPTSSIGSIPGVEGAFTIRQCLSQSLNQFYGISVPFFMLEPGACGAIVLAMMRDRLPGFGPAIEPFGLSSSYVEPTFFFLSVAYVIGRMFYFILY